MNDPQTARIYLDHNATTPLRAEVVERMISLLRDGFGNPSSTHAEGARAQAAVDRAREQVAACLRVNAREVFFTACATEANSTVLRGITGSGRVISTQTEHPSVLAPLDFLEKAGVRIHRLAVDAAGLLDLDQLDEALQEDAQLVSIIWANNETGVMQPMQEIAERVKARGVALHVDATQALGKAEVDLERVPVDFLSSSAHKLNGPKGVGCLFIRDGQECASLLLGGPQERRFRGGTENVASIAGFGVACELAMNELPKRIEDYGALRDRLWQSLERRVPRVRRNGDTKSVLCNTLNVEFQDTAGDVLLQALDLEGIAVSVGAACHSGSIAPSHVLTAMGRSPEEARGSLRLSVGHGVVAEQVDRAIELLASLVPRVRDAGPG